MKKKIAIFFSWFNIIGWQISIQEDIRFVRSCVCARVWIFVFIFRFRHLHACVESVRIFLFYWNKMKSLRPVKSRVISITIEMQNPNTIKPKLPTDIHSSKSVPYSKWFRDIFQHSSSKNSNKYPKKFFYNKH